MDIITITMDSGYELALKGCTCGQYDDLLAAEDAVSDARGDARAASVLQDDAHRAFLSGVYGPGYRDIPLVERGRAVMATVGYSKGLGEDAIKNLWRSGSGERIQADPDSVQNAES